MASNLEKIKEIISRDKRLCERLTLPLRIRYAKVPDSAPRVLEWSDFVWLDNIGGEGFGFGADEVLSMDEKLKIELKLPCAQRPFLIGAQVVRIQKKDGAELGSHGGNFFYGVKIFELPESAQGKFEEFISDGIIDKYIDDKGQLKDIES